MVVAGNNCTAEDSRPAQEMRLVSPAYFAVEAKMPRVPQIHVFAYFQDMQVSAQPSLPSPADAFALCHCQEPAATEPNVPRPCAEPQLDSE